MLGNPQQLSIRRTGQDSSIGVMEGTFLHARPPYSRKLMFPSTCARNHFVIVFMIKDCRTAPNHASALAGSSVYHLTVSKIICLGIEPPKRNMFLVLKSPYCLPNELLRLHQTNTLTGRLFPFGFLHQPRGLVSYMASHTD